MKNGEAKGISHTAVSCHLEERRGVFHLMLSWKGADGKRVRKSISTGLPIKGNKKRAEDIMAKTRQEYEKKLNTSASELLFADYLEQWLDAIEPTIEVTTFAGYSNNINRVIAPYFRDKGITLGELTAADINDFYTVQLKRVKAATVQRYHANIHQAIKHAVLNDLIPHSIMDKVMRPKSEQFVGEFLREAEVIELFEAIKGHKLELGVIFGAFYGLRRGEILGLKWDAIDFDANTIVIGHTVTKVTIDGKKSIIERDRTKSKSSMRTLPLIPLIKARLLEIRDEQKKNRKLFGNGYNKHEGKYVYVDELGNHMNPDYITVEFRKFMRNNGLRDMRFHDLRHSCASLMLASGVSLKHIQEWLGHSTYSITADIYAHLDCSAKKESANAMKWVHQTHLSQYGVQ